ncbi:MAG TPA: DNA-3-methyladenine glycosylase I [Alphaproteobacteria bacterium]|jgi:DNA-3-methyladenine glycosylase I|nr:DNA-3-methyladenine glycosylase I [Alphaproteobacteria bacterium]MDP6270126.1 DNA-3-methyladenine glycosylase I [Alphaproteobacteria bacterium]MDP7164467.1 DNA-3-methyladenine glycosylase I [Alphaproteobacteria bacterium]MDP7429807.1 DNA-3-methyladenine glycosylase I [Alphaproteobacteria bacterium]HJM49602.1 DNA-3-methyladenine glycosylase I [Alphaproteobacteria bacterium]
MAGLEGRCSWPGDDALYVAYHDEEWGVPERDDRALFEKLLLDGFQAGLSWLTILRKRDNFRRAFAGFEPQKMARFGPNKIESLMQDKGIVRNRLKVESAVRSARAYLEIREAGQSFEDFIWQFTEGRTIANRFREMADIPSETAESRAMSKALKAAGFNFCGPTICYAFMQATGIVNDHVVDCFRHDQV